MGNIVAFGHRPIRGPLPEESVTGPERAVYTVTEVARLLSLSRGTTYALVRDGTIPARRLGCRWVISRAQFHAWLDGLREEAPGGPARSGQKDRY